MTGPVYLYLIERRHPVDWDENAGAVVRARSSATARKTAARELSGAEDPDTWLRPDASKLTKIGDVSPGANRKTGVVLADFKAG